MGAMKKAWYLLPILLLMTGCLSYDWTQVPVGVQQYPLDLRVGGLTQRYTVIQPQQSPPSGSPSRHPALVLLHSGFGGDEHVSAQLARRLAGRGMVVILPSYRGELRRLDHQRSEGRIEYCRGEVDDAEAALQWLRGQPLVDPERLAALGASHGGCIALRLGQRAPDLRAIVTLSAPVAAAPFVQHLREEPDGTYFFNAILAGWLQSYIKTSPRVHPEAYEERSPLSGMERVHSALLVIHGTQDVIVPVAQACWLYQVLARDGRSISERWLDPQGTLHAPSASFCPIVTAPSTAPARSARPARPERTDFVFALGQGHAYGARALRAAQDLAVAFLTQELRF
jgi:alpha/beta superfamily hydrolase